MDRRKQPNADENEVALYWRQAFAVIGTLTLLYIAQEEMAPVISFFFSRSAAWFVFLPFCILT